MFKFVLCLSYTTNNFLCLLNAFKSRHTHICHDEVTVLYHRYDLTKVFIGVRFDEQERSVYTLSSLKIVLSELIPKLFYCKLSREDFHFGPYKELTSADLRVFHSFQKRFPVLNFHLSFICVKTTLHLPAQ